jgi:hypothetical protein
MTTQSTNNKRSKISSSSSSEKNNNDNQLPITVWVGTMDTQAEGTEWHPYTIGTFSTERAAWILSAICEWEENSQRFSDYDQDSAKYQTYLNAALAFDEIHENDTRAINTAVAALCKARNDFVGDNEYWVMEASVEQVTVEDDQTAIKQRNKTLVSHNVPVPLINNASKKSAQFMA